MHRRPLDQKVPCEVPGTILIQRFPIELSQGARQNLHSGVRFICTGVVVQCSPPLGISTIRLRFDLARAGNHLCNLLSNTIHDGLVVCANGCGHDSGMSAGPTPAGEMAPRAVGSNSIVAVVKYVPSIGRLVLVSEHRQVRR